MNYICICKNETVRIIHINNCCKNSNGIYRENHYVTVLQNMLKNKNNILK